MSASKSKPPNYSPPIIFPPLQEHKHTLIILHGRGSTAQKFAEPLLQHSVTPLTTLTTSTNSNNVAQLSFRDHLPHAKFIFPTAPLRRAVAFNRSLTHQWFDSWSLTEPKLKQHLQIQGLRETTEYLHNLLRGEMEEVGPENVVLMGLSQGCAASIVAAMLWQGEPLAAVVGMCGYLPFCEDIYDHVKGLESEDADSQGILRDEYEEDLFERPDGECDEGTKLETAVDWLCEEIQFDQDGIQVPSLPSIASMPVFMGHGTDDDKVPIERGRRAVELLHYIDVAITAKEYEGLGHWYSGDMLQDVIQFLQKLKGWEDFVLYVLKC